MPSIDRFSFLVNLLNIPENPTTENTQLVVAVLGLINSMVLLLAKVSERVLLRQELEELGLHTKLREVILILCKTYFQYFQSFTYFCFAVRDQIIRPNPISLSSVESV
jgi:hypothetical protein